MSKWNHADITALADAGDRLLAAGANVQAALQFDPNFERTFTERLATLCRSLLPSPHSSES
jgi:hypothetical protein